MPPSRLEKCVQTDCSVFHTSARPGFRPFQPEICPSRDTGDRRTRTARLQSRAHRDCHPDRRAHALPTSVARTVPSMRLQPFLVPGRLSGAPPTELPRRRAGVRNNRPPVHRARRPSAVPTGGAGRGAGVWGMLLHGSTLARRGHPGRSLGEHQAPLSDRDRVLATATVRLWRAYQMFVSMAPGPPAAGPWGMTPRTRPLQCHQGHPGSVAITGPLPAAGEVLGAE